MKLTEEMILAGQTGNGGWNRAQLAALGIDWPPHKGWKRRLIGTEISEQQYQRFLQLKHFPKSDPRQGELL